MYKLSSAECEEIEKKIDELLWKGPIRPSISSWGSPIIFVPKRTAHIECAFTAER